MKRVLIVVAVLLVAAGIALAVLMSGGKADLPIEAVQGPNPQLVGPKKRFFPVVNVAKAIGWKGDAHPVPAPGLQVTGFAAGLQHPRWLYVLPNGDVLVAETNAPPKPDDGKGVRGWVQGLLMGHAGSTGESANRITLLRDADGDGRAEFRSVFLSGLHSPFGMTLANGRLFIADTDAVVSVPYANGDVKASAAPVKLADLPAGTINHHWTKNVIATPDGSKLYVTVGSNSNVGENGMLAEEGPDHSQQRAAIWEIDPRTAEKRIYAYGLRNPNGLAWEPISGELWTTVNERDEIGSDIVPDYMTHVQFGGFYGWPWFYWGGFEDSRPEPKRPDLQDSVIRPDYALGPHTASLGLAFAAGAQLGPRFANGAFVGQHGSWNRRPLSGYKVVFVPFGPKGMPTGAKPVDVLTGFLSKDEQAQGRPVGVAIDKRGGLLVADDVGNRVWRVSATR
jgi:glucose/arabinose dehydrogenase